MRWFLLVVALVAALTGTAGAQTATPTATATATPTPTATATQSPTPTATITPAPQIACGAGSAAGGAQATGVCGGVCLGTKVCRWDNTSANTGCTCVDLVSDCNTAAGGVGAGMCQTGYCDRPSTMPGGQCTTVGRHCGCR